MKKFRMSLYGLCVACCLLIAAPALAPVTEAAGEKLRAEEIVAKHLDSIGTSEARAAARSMIVGGTVVTTLRSPSTAQFSGQAVIASEAGKSLIAMMFENSNYTQEKFVFDGQNVAVGYTRPGARSNLGEFLYTYNGVIRNGLVGGTLTADWPLLNPSDRKAKLETGGAKKIAGRQAYEVKFVPRGGSNDLQISLFFDAETFQHVRTEYTRLISAGIGANVDASGGQRATRYKMTEDFSDFRKEGALTLPHSYQIALELDTRNGTFQGEWKLTLNQFSFNQPIPASYFNAGGE